MEILYIKRKKRRRFKKPVLVAVALALLAAVLITLGLMYIGGSEGKARIGKIETVQRVTAVVVRSENVVQTDEFDLADRYLKQGQSVSAGDRVMDVYKLGYSREITLSLWRTRQEVYDEQLKVLGEARDVELRNFDNGIEEAKRSLSNAVLSGDTTGVLALRGELTALLNERSEYLRSAIQETEALRGLYRTQEDRERATSDSRISLIAEKSGIVSYYFDDYSVALNADKLSTVTGDLIDSIIKKSNRTLRWTGSSKTSAYRLIDPGEWYIAFNTAASRGLRVTVGEKYPIELQGYGSFEGVAVASFVSGQRVVNIIKLTDDMGALMDARTVKAAITFAAEGIRVEKRAVQINDKGEPYVEIMVDGKRSGVYVDVRSEDGGYAIVSAKNVQTDPLVEGVKYWIPKK